MTTIRRAEPFECEAVFLLAKAFATSFAVERTSFEASFSHLLQSPDALLIVALDGKEVIGYLLGFDHVAFFANGRVSWIEEIMVSVERRGQGTGRRLMAEFEKWAIQRQSRLVALATRRASSFYQGLGYEESATYFRRLLVP